MDALVKFQGVWLILLNHCARGIWQDPLPLQEGKQFRIALRFLQETSLPFPLVPSQASEHNGLMIEETLSSCVLLGNVSPQPTRDSSRFKYS